MMLAVAAVASLPLFVLARRGELSGNPERFVGVIVAVLLVECLLYPAQSEVPDGPFRIPALGGSIRTHDYLVMIGLLARAVTRPVPRRVTGAGVLWFLAFVWLTTTAARGFLLGNRSSVILFTGTSLVALFGGRVLVGGCDPERLIALLRGRWVVPLAAVVLLLLPNAAGTPRTYLGTGLGDIHVDTASVFVAIGTFVLLVGWSVPQGRPWVALVALPFLLTPFTIEQRATLVHLAGSLLVIGWAMAQRRWNVAMRVPRAAFAWGVVAITIPALTLSIVHLNDPTFSLPFASYYERTFTSEGNRLSAQARLDALEIGLSEWAADRLYGRGLGHTYEVVRPGGIAREPVTFDNVPLDVLVRSGLVGLVLFGAAALATVRDGVRVWLNDRRATVAALGLAAVAVVAGLGAKSLFESILEKGKVALTIGLTTGVIAAIARSSRRPDAPPSSAPRRDEEGRRWI